MFSEHLSTLHLSLQPNVGKRVQHASCNLSRPEGVVVTVSHGENANIAFSSFSSDRLSAVVFEKPSAITIRKGQEMSAVEVNVILEED